MKQEAATQIKSKANRNKTIRTLMTDKSQHILAYYVPFGITLPDYFGYFSQWELFHSLLPNLNICISNIVTNFLFSDWEEHAIETRGTLSTFFFFLSWQTLITAYISVSLLIFDIMVIFCIFVFLYCLSLWMTWSV